MDYPFTALVGQDALKTALSLIAVNPSIGGVLIRGERGTAKSTAARALAALLPHLRVVSGCPFNCDPEAPWAECPHCDTLPERTAVEASVPFVDLPLGATEDRVLGTLDFERALREGRRSFQPGLLASAHRGILYIDEVNLLADHLVDVLLDAAALGVNTVQREGVAVIHPAKFLLIGTMNPEEGDLRPQLLDRFGLMMEVTGPREPEPRVEVVRRRLAFEADPEAFAKSWAGEQQTLRERIVTARSRLTQVKVPENLLQLISRICCEFAVDGLRGDIVMHKTAQARAAFESRCEVSVEDIRAAAELVLPHRRRRRPFEQPSLDRDKLNNLLTPPTTTPDEPPGRDEAPAQGEDNPGQREQSAATEQVFAGSIPGIVRKLEIESTSKQVSATHGRHNPTPANSRGHYVRAVLDEKPAALALDATVRATVRRGGFQNGTLRVESCDLHRKERAGKTGTQILFVVDSSGSMAARQRMELVKGAVLRLLEDAYKQRDRVGVIAFRGPEAQVLLPFTGSVEQAASALRELPTGGRTPLAHALALAGDVVRKSRMDGPILLIVISDGKANVAMPGGAGDAWPQALEAAEQLAGAAVPTLVLDSEVGYIRAGRARQLAQALAAEYVPLEDFSADDLVLKVRAKV